jgi:hypothetical protein
LDIVDIESIVVRGTVDQHLASSCQSRQGDREFIDVRVVKAAVELTDYGPAMEQQGLCAKPFVKHSILTGRSHAGRIEAIGIVDIRRDYGSVEVISYTPAGPVD